VCALIDLSNKNGQDDHLALRQTLIDGVKHSTGVENVSLFEMKVNYDSDKEEREEEGKQAIIYYRNAMDQNALFKNIEQRKMMHEALKKRAVRSDTNPNNRNKRYAIPILGGVISEILSVETNKISENSFHTIDFLVKIYRNYMLLLNKYERDALTGLLNRRSFEERLNRCINQMLETTLKEKDAAEKGQSIPTEEIPHLAVLDIDHFKLVNDTYGHLYGDDVLLLFSNKMKESFSAETSLYRFGGEEFVVVMNSSKSNALAELEKFRKEIERFNFPQVGTVTVSIGFTQIDDGCTVSSSIIDRADQALYYAKEHGRNRTCSYDELIKSGELVKKTIEEGETELF
jgi:diguanylate cyclase (GGDEF)-like protein